MPIIVRRTFHVHPDGSDGNGGRTWADAVLTIAQAQTLATSGRGDRILIAPSSSSYAVPNITKDYLSLENAIPGSSYARPDLVTATNGPTISGQGVVLKGLRIVGQAGYGLRIQSNGGRLEWCVIEGTTDCIQLLPDNTSASDALTASEWEILHSLIRDGAQGIRFKNPGPAAGLGGVGPTHITAMHNRFLNITNEDVIDEDTAGSNDKTFYDCVLAHNYHMDRNKAVYVTLTNGGGNRGMVHGYFADDAGLDSTKIALASGIVFLGQQAAGMVNGSGF